MCLHTQEKFKVHKYVGWKFFLKLPQGKLRSWYQDSYWTPWKWNKDTSSLTLYDTKSLPYETGYHIYLRKKDAEKNSLSSGSCTIRKVRFGKVVATGFEGILRTVPVVVAKEAMVVG